MMRVLRKIIAFFVSNIAHILNQELEKYTNEQYEKNIKCLLAKLQSCGIGVKINGNIVVTDPTMVCLGNNVHIGDGACISSEGGICIGDNTHINRNVTIYSTSHNYKGHCLPYDESIRHKPVLIGKNVWIGMNVNISPGTIIEDGAVIGLGSNVSGHILRGSICGHAKPVVINKRDDEHYRHLARLNKYGGVKGKPLINGDVNNAINNMKEGKIFFVVSTGRSGTTSIASYLNHSNQVDFKHEPRKQVMRLSYEYACNIKSEIIVKNELNALYQSCLAEGVPIYGESDHYLFNMINLLKEITPTAKFIWLVRDGREVVSSGLARGWYSEEETNENYEVMLMTWNKYRIRGDKCGDVEKKIWHDMSSFESNCWYWSYVNRKIELQLSNIESIDWIKIKLEDISNDLDKLINFIGIENIDNEFPLLNTNINQVKKHSGWTELERKSFEKICGPMMNKLYGES